MEVRLDGVRFSRGERAVLDIPGLAFAHGSTTALFGPNGSGKTTLLRLIAGLETPGAGKVSPAHVAFSFQRPVFIRGSVHQNLELGLLLRRVAEVERRDRIHEAAEGFGIVHLLERRARALSAGEAQRVNLARALCLRAPVTLLDEPLAGLDRGSRGRLLEELPHLLRTFATTTILVTHDREEAFRLAEELVVLVAGRVLARGPSGDVYRSPGDAATAELLGYTIVSCGAGTIAVPPGGLRPVSAPEGEDFRVERTVDMGNHRDVIGLIGPARVTMRLPEGNAVPHPGQVIRVRIDRGVRLGPGVTAVTE